MEKVYLYSQKNGWFNREGLYIFDNPVFVVEYKNRRTYLNGRDLGSINLFNLIEKIIKKYKLYGLGYISYNYGKSIVLDKVFTKRRDINLPDIYILFFKNYTFHKNFDYPELKQIVKNVKINVSKEEFINKVLRIKKYIESGDIYQVNLAHRIDLEGFFYPEVAFFNLLDIQKTPYLMLLKGINFSVLSGSMELFLRKEGNTLITEPIKGTRPRGKTKEEDKRLFAELKNSEKEIAENLMITDLMRNDLGRICKKVYVKDLFKVERYSTLYQMSSTVIGELTGNIRIKDIINNTFPPGSITGAPKKRAMEIIEELEDVERSVYCGATVLFKPNLDIVMSVAIRQIIFKERKGYIYVGSGIVYNSNPEEEYKETLIKAKANLKALDLDLAL
ncbi:MAG: anthranilate synthase component I family protein [Persephonella sp.]|nr:MAG: anthranilate synthase component I family protein [Persephonella sp.]